MGMGIPTPLRALTLQLSHRAARHGTRAVRQQLTTLSLEQPSMNVATDNGFATATRIAAGDDGTNYDGVAISLHWATALLVVANFALAETWDWFAKPTQHLLQTVHMSFGILLGLVIV